MTLPPASSPLPAQPCGPHGRAGGGRILRHARRGWARAQRGAVLLFSLVILVVLLISAVALVRSFDTSLLIAGNLSFQRDLVNQGERAVPVVFDAFSTAGAALATPVGRAANNTAVNYSAVMLPTNAQGIPNALLDDAAFGAVGLAGNDIAVDDQQVTVRYVVDRLCRLPGLESPEECVFSEEPVPPGGSTLGETTSELAPPQRVVYRISIRVTGPRNTQSFIQTTFTL